MEGLENRSLSKAERARELVGTEGIKEALRYLGLPEADTLSEEALRKISELQAGSKGKLKVDGILGMKTLSYIRVLRNSRDTLSPLQTVGTKPLDIGQLGEVLGPRWKVPFDDFIARGSFRDKSALALGKPCILIDAATGQGILFSGGRVIETFSVILGNGGVESVESLADMKGLRGKGKTGAGIIYHFDDTIVPQDEYANSSRSGRARSVIGATLCSPEGVAGGGRWFHGVPEGDRVTEGCIGMPVKIARRAATLVAGYGGGLGYVYNG